MDIGKYIGKFLVKNSYCSLSGLGVFDLKKNTATFNTDGNSVSPPSHTITFNPIGSIDDSFASFIANQENVSISNASNNIKQYCIDAKQTLQQQGSFEIVHIGKLSFNGGKISFQQSSDIDFGYEPVPMPITEFKSSISNDASGKLDFSYPPAHSTYQSKSSSSMMKYVLIGGVALLVLGGIYMGIDYYKNNNVNTEELLKPNTTSNEIAATNDTATASTTSSPIDSNTSSLATPTPSPGAHLVALFSFTNESAAAAKAKKLANYGNKTAVSKIDSAKYIVTIEASHPLGDTTLLVDSLRRFFNPKGDVYILK